LYQTSSYIDFLNVFSINISWYHEI
jgi:hypothetical protein